MTLYCCKLKNLCTSKVIWIFLYISKIPENLIKRFLGKILLSRKFNYYFFIILIIVTSAVFSKTLKYLFISTDKLFMFLIYYFLLLFLRNKYTINTTIITKIIPIIIKATFFFVLLFSFSLICISLLIEVLSSLVLNNSPNFFDFPLAFFHIHFVLLHSFYEYL